MLAHFCLVYTIGSFVLITSDLKQVNEVPLITYSWKALQILFSSILNAWAFQFSYNSPKSHNFEIEKTGSPLNFFSILYQGSEIRITLHFVSRPPLLWDHSSALPHIFTEDSHCPLFTHIFYCWFISSTVWLVVPSPQKVCTELLYK